MKACGGSRGVALLFLTRALEGVNGQLHDPAALPPVTTKRVYGYNVRARCNHHASLLHNRDEQSAGARRCITAEHESITGRDRVRLGQISHSRTCIFFLFTSYWLTLA
jgi:hypothetical protein